jgi:tRNA(fMet)-specific endonuclease VapC
MMLRRRAHGPSSPRVVALGEYLEGFDDVASAEAQALVAPLQLLAVTLEAATLYANVARDLRRRGRLIGSNDLWIACTARAAGLAILTRNASDFRRVRGLEVVEY